MTADDIDRAIQSARERYQFGNDDDVEIDDVPRVSLAEDGCWVAAWVWVSNEDVK